MFNLSLNDIHIGATAPNKQNAIEQVAAALTEAGYVKNGYVQGMLEREHQAPTFLGNGIAIPHGTTDTRAQVLNTGFAVFQFPQGIDWGDGQTAYIVIGIAAQSDEHLALLRQLTHVISDENIAQAMAKAGSAEELKSLLMGDNQVQPLKFDDSTVILNTNVDNMNALKLQNIVNLQNIQVISTDFITRVLTEAPIYLGQGVWLSDSVVGNIHSAIALSTVKHQFSYQDKPVKILITISYANNQVDTFLSIISQLLQHKKIDDLLKIDNVNNLISLFSGQPDESESAERGITEEFIVRNPHGLHTRPSTLLVSTIKKFESTITVSNLDAAATPVNGRSLMKMVSLGAKCGHRLRIHAEGTDAQEAISAIGAAINAGLGEEIA
ncbi:MULTISPECIES: fused PTS fructose transporter subunit IIA/HPr protein [Providencia]|uniref:fused PTS fructose transporter subunit IIA/HPr protein n=1 Tax=Providencia TaxID=586 RepID=UPI000837DA01|nr:fused PTS fructose transporter subunit IIA/HPr protein [Providencia heimbachae]MBP6123159.1 fused PTS fructose transporter subunit IIA/HPr protein [Providencia sp.]MDD9339787.1 fused PTS fructose transporter subunit IIA/HPr protein [Providencia heimbachae]NIH21801.1 fused PTS fructose transporter subunit IIA/HPr protein [Providencia heimbachae]